MKVRSKIDCMCKQPPIHFLLLLFLQVKFDYLPKSLLDFPDQILFILSDITNELLRISLVRSEL
jgi:hypothetical protein